jgi:hypothetical protein
VNDSAWYDRLALVLMTHYGGDKEKKRDAVLVCHEGLTDPDTHLSKRLVIKFSSTKRLTRVCKLFSLSSTSVASSEKIGEAA